MACVFGYVAAMTARIMTGLEIHEMTRPLSFRLVRAQHRLRKSQAKRPRGEGFHLDRRQGGAILA